MYEGGSADPHAEPVEAGPTTPPAPPVGSGAAPEESWYQPDEARASTSWAAIGAVLALAIGVILVLAAFAGGRGASAPAPSRVRQ